MTTAGDAPQVSFVVRLWLEPNVDQPEWRGQVTHVQGQASTYFRDFGVLLDFLARYSGVDIPLVAGSEDVARADGAR